LSSAYAAAEPLAAEVRRDFVIDQNSTGHLVLDGRLPYTLEGLLGGFFQKNRIGVLAEKWKHLRARG